MLIQQYMIIIADLSWAFFPQHLAWLLETYLLLLEHHSLILLLERHEFEITGHQLWNLFLPDTENLKNNLISIYIYIILYIYIYIHIYIYICHSFLCIHINWYITDWRKNKWEMTLHHNVASHWLSPCPEWWLLYYSTFQELWTWLCFYQTGSA